MKTAFWDFEADNFRFEMRLFLDEYRGKFVYKLEYDSNCRLTEDEQIHCLRRAIVMLKNEKRERLERELKGKNNL